MIARADAVRLPFSDGAFDLVIGSPPYVDCRLYLEGGRDLGIARKCEEWIDWMLAVTTESLRVCKGPVIWVAAGATRDWSYQPAPEGLMYRWWQAGGSMFRPCYWRRVGIPGSGGSSWYRADVEYCLCFKRPGELSYADPTANGHPPKHRPGGDMSYRTVDGSRINGRSKAVTRRQANGARAEETYLPPALANPGNLLQIDVGGGTLGSMLAHENEAPYPEKLPEWFINSHCPPGGTVFDPFGGSGTTLAAATALGRVGVTTDIRQSQCLLARRRLRATQPGFAFA